MLSANDVAYLSRKKDEIVNHCPICKGRKAFCQCQYAFQFEYTKIRANIPVSVRDFQLNEITHSRLATIKDYVVKYAGMFKAGDALPNLVIVGTNARVTNGLAAFLLMEVLRCKRTGYYFPSMLDAKTAATKNWSAKEKREPDCVALNTYDVIVIAGFGTGTESGTAAYEELKEVIKTRGANGLLTIFVSHLEFAKLPEPEKAIIGVCRAAEMNCRNWGCSEAAGETNTFFIPSVIDSLTEAEKQELERLDALAANEATLPKTKLTVSKTVTGAAKKKRKSIASAATPKRNKKK